MTPRAPLRDLATHEVTNQPPPLAAYNMLERDHALSEALKREGGGWACDRVSAFGAEMGAPETMELANRANRHKPVLHAFDRYGQRIDEVEFHPAYHELMDLAISHAIPSVAWTAEQPGHVVHTALEYLFGQIEGGVCCPVTMTYAAVPVIRQDKALARQWLPKILGGIYDPRMIPVEEKSGATIGMAMTEKQGGSDVRANTTRATPTEDGWYRLDGHKWFCSAPMSDAFLTLAQADGGLTCFFVPRWRPDGTRNPFLIQRLKDKLGNWSNASSEIEYADTRGRRLGEEGRGVATIMEMVHHTRLDTAMAPAALMRQALVQAIHHARHRTVFGKTLADQPLMARVLADLALESEAAVTLLMRVARAYDEGAGGYARLMVAVTKYWHNKRAPAFVYEAMECLGGVGYVEESVMPRLYREAPLNSIWEGSGNVICLDVLRTLSREPEAMEAMLAEVSDAASDDRALAAAIKTVKDMLAHPEALEGQARLLTERLALLMQGALLRRHAPPGVADAFIASRFGPDRGQSYGALPLSALPLSTDCEGILARAWPE